MKHQDIKSSVLQYIILYATVACVALLLATLARISASSMGFDNFTTFMVFIIVLSIETIVYLSIHVILQELMLPCIGKGLSKIPYLKKRAKANPIPIPVIEQKEINKEQIRNEHLQSEIEKFNTALEIAHEYTQKTFAPYLSDSEINRLCSYITLSVERKELKSIISIKPDNQLTTTDIYHFGWNIWNHFQVSDQMQMAKFLKITFAYTFREVEDIETIKKKLKIFEPKCKIQIRENLSE
ncbi:MAG: hypothetical protein LBU51_00205 [Bacteroidales bacterium]|jgi:hypothetical protein|nr:hypothetical protein [Bacteroidales bacterium]